MASSWGKSWGKSWGNSWGKLPIVGGGAEKTKVKPKREKKEDYTDDEVKGMEAVYGSEFSQEPKTTQETEPIPEKTKLPGLESFSDGYMELIDSKVEMSPEIRKELEDTQDIGLILAIIEAID